MNSCVATHLLRQDHDDDDDDDAFICPISSQSCLSCPRLHSLRYSFQERDAFCVWILQFSFFYNRPQKQVKEGKNFFSFSFPHFFFNPSLRWIRAWKKAENFCPRGNSSAKAKRVTTNERPTSLRLNNLDVYGYIFRTEENAVNFGAARNDVLIRPRREWEKFHELIWKILKLDTFRTQYNYGCGFDDDGSTTAAAE